MADSVPDDVRTELHALRRIVRRVNRKVNVLAAYMLLLVVGVLLLGAFDASPAAITCTAAAIAAVAFFHYAFADLLCASLDRQDAEK